MTNRLQTLLSKSTCAATPGRGGGLKSVPDSPLARQGTLRLRKVQKDAKGDEGVSEWLVDWEVRWRTFHHR
jgi:hypothetical protein